MRASEGASLRVLDRLACSQTTMSGAEATTTIVRVRMHDHAPPHKGTGEKGLND